MAFRRLIICAAFAVAFALVLSAQTTVTRPDIVGVAHIGLKTNDLAAARNFYGRDLGFQEPFTLDKATGGLLLTYFKVNDHQYIEVFPELKDESDDRLSHIAFETTNIAQLRDYLASRGVKVPDSLKPGPSPKTLGVMNHLALGVPSVDAAYKRLIERGMNLQNLPPKIGRDGKWQLNLYDPNLTRAELMEPTPVQTPCCSPFIKF
jgi:catechol 2,3-dioxygenase-like lactoylglutathione lyase family enzyme